MSFGAKADEVIARDLGLAGEDDFDERIPQGTGSGNNPLAFVERHIDPLSRRQLRALMFLHLQGEEWKETIDFFLKIRTLQGGSRDLLVALENMRSQKESQPRPSLFGGRRREI